MLDELPPFLTIPPRPTVAPPPPLDVRIATTLTRAEFVGLLALALAAGFVLGYWAAS